MSVDAHKKALASALASKARLQTGDAAVETRRQELELRRQIGDASETAYCLGRLAAELEAAGDPVAALLAVEEEISLRTEMINERT